MKFDQKQFVAQIPSSFSSVLDELQSFGLTPTLVGGSVRDYFLNGTLGKDWDVELTHETLAFNKDEWKALGKRLSRLGRVSYLPYEVIRLDLDGYQMEFSPPRIETFFEDRHHHSNFTAEFIFKLPFEEALQRRDFTINAMGIRFKSGTEIEFLDPSEGLRHLRDKVLFPVGTDFQKDPVRFLRALRFSLKLNFTISPELRKIMDAMKLLGITPSYFWSEMQKSQRPVEFLERIMGESPLHPELKLPLATSEGGKLQSLKPLLTEPGKQESWLIALEWVGISSELWREYFGLNSDSCRRLCRWARACQTFRTLLPETFHGEFDQVKMHEKFEELFDWYFATRQLIQKYPELPILKMIEEYLPEWIHLFRFEAPKDVKHIDPPLRAKYQVWNLCQRI